MKNSFQNIIKICFFTLFLMSIASSQTSIVNSVHNLSTSGTGTLKSTTESEICLFCHAAHNGTGQAPLWNRDEPATVYSLYGSSTMISNNSQPGVTSKLCLSCHDGTTALGLISTRTEQIAFPVGYEKIPPENRSNLSNVLADDHPIELTNIPGSANEYVDGITNVKCTSCHNPHDNSYGDFLITDPISGGICLQCHQKTNWSSSSHSTSTATWNNTTPNPWPIPTNYASNVSNNACQNCHTPHDAASSEWILANVNEEDNCLKCHNGNVATEDIETALTKTYGHKVSNYSGIHTPSEDPATMSKHVECSDCHNPHQADNTSASSPIVSGPLKGVKGIDKSGQVIASSANEYEICLKCHETAGTSYINRFNLQSSIREEFLETTPSYHPVYGAGANSNVPSLYNGWTTSSIVRCTDCHNTSATSGPNGPHSSDYAPILAAPMEFNDYNSGDPATIYALCNKCHDINGSILQDESFSKHHTHIVDEQASCMTCHDPHGSQIYTHLQNYNTDYVSKSKMAGYLAFQDNGIYRGRCYMLCHGKDHRPKGY